MKNIELINSASQTVTSGGRLNLGTVNIRTCFGAFNYNNIDTITLVQPGTYQLLVKSDLTATAAAQIVEYSVVYNGTVSSIASATAELTAIGDTITLTVPKLIKICSEPISLTIVNSGLADTEYSNLIVDIVKVG